MKYKKNLVEVFFNIYFIFIYLIFLVYLGYWGSSRHQVASGPAQAGVLLVMFWAGKSVVCPGVDDAVTTVSVVVVVVVTAGCAVVVVNFGSPTSSTSFDVGSSVGIGICCWMNGFGGATCWARPHCAWGELSRASCAGTSTWSLGLVCLKMLWNVPATSQVLLERHLSKMATNKTTHNRNFRQESLAILQFKSSL